jgi:hypothetical protein
LIDSRIIRCIQTDENLRILWNWQPLYNLIQILRTNFGSSTRFFHFFG